MSTATEAVRHTHLIRRKYIRHDIFSTNQLTAAVGSLQLYFPIRRCIVSNYSEDGLKLLMGWAYGIVNCTLHHVTPT